MTLKDLIMQTSFKKVSPEVRRVLHGYAAPYTPLQIKRFRRAFEMLREMKPEPNVMKLYVMHCNVNGFYDEETLETLRKDNPDIWEGAYSVVGTPWKDLLGMEIDAESQERLSLDAIVANCLYEMLYWGFEEERESLIDEEEDVEEDKTEENINEHVVIHTVENGVVSIYEGTNKIPDNYFMNFTGMETIVIPDSVTSIGENAFFGCNNLSKVVISDVTAWCNISFANSESNPLYHAKRLFFNKKEITELEIPNGVISISDYAFEGCEGITSVLIPSSVRIIGKNAFSDCFELSSVFCKKGVMIIDDDAFSCCRKLTAISIPGSVIVIGDSAFFRCEGLTSLMIPESVKSIGDRAFLDCSRLFTITVAQGNLIYDSREDCNAIIETNSNKLILGCNSTKIPKSVKSIGDYAFRGCAGLVSVVIPNTITNIGIQVFCGCDNLKSVVLPKSLTILKKDLFSGCSQLSSIVIPESVKLIESDVFSGCSSLVSIHIPQNVEEILPGQFAYCDNLVSVTVDCENPYFDSRDGCNAIIESKTNNLISGCNRSVIPNSVVELFDRAFANCSEMDTISIPSSVVRIGNSVFKWCYDLTEVEIPESVTLLGYGVFYGCNKLKSVIIRGNNAKLAYEAFEHCSAQTILVPRGTAEKYKEMLSQDVHGAIKEREY